MPYSGWGPEPPGALSWNASETGASVGLEGGWPRPSFTWQVMQPVALKKGPAAGARRRASLQSRSKTPLPA